MNHHLSYAFRGGLALILVAASSSPSSLSQAGEIVVKAPFTFVRVAGQDQPAPGVTVDVPFVRFSLMRRTGFVGSGQPTVVPQGPPLEVLPPPKPAPGENVIVEPPSSRPLVEPPSLPNLPTRPPTHAEFASAFKPAAGTYEVVLLHPDTRAPVRVCFNLPPGCPKKVRVERHELEFDYGKYEVEIRFKRDGRVSVEYND